MDSRWSAGMTNNSVACLADLSRRSTECVGRSETKADVVVVRKGLVVVGVIQKRAVLCVLCGLVFLKERRVVVVKRTLVAAVRRWCLKKRTSCRRGEKDFQTPQQKKAPAYKAGAFFIWLFYLFPICSQKPTFSGSASTMSPSLTFPFSFLSLTLHLE